MAGPKCGKPPLRDAGGGSLKVQCLAACTSENSTSRLILKELPSRATLARRWPGLRVNRLTWRWRDDASGARGDSIESLLAFLGEGAR